MVGVGHPLEDPVGPVAVKPLAVTLSARLQLWVVA
jgi:hypothetical protein